MAKMTFSKGKLSRFEKYLEHIEIQEAKELGATNIIDIGKHIGITYPAAHLKVKKIR